MHQNGSRWDLCLFHSSHGTHIMSFSLSLCTAEQKYPLSTVCACTPCLVSQHQFLNAHGFFKSHLSINILDEISQKYENKNSIYAPMHDKHTHSRACARSSGSSMNKIKIYRFYPHSLTLASKHTHTAGWLHVFVLNLRRHRLVF